MLHTVHIKEIMSHTVRVEAPVGTDSHAIYATAIASLCPDTIVDATIKEEAIFIGDSIASLSEELNIWCNNRGFPQISADDLLSRDDLHEHEAAYLELFIKRWDNAISLDL